MVEFVLGQFTCFVGVFVLAHRRLHQSATAIQSARVSGVHLVIHQVPAASHITRTSAVSLLLGVCPFDGAVSERPTRDMIEFVFGQFVRLVR